MASDWRRPLLFGAVAFGLLLAAYRLWPRTSAGAAPSSNQAGTARNARSDAERAPLAGPDVRLETLAGERTAPGAGGRDLFRFKPRAAPPPSEPARPAPMRPEPAGPPAAAPVQPIALKFIGIIDRGGQRIAVLSDSAGHVDYGAEGAIIGGRYRVLKIGVESIEMAHLDGRGRQVIRLTGS
ncbi:MAG: hypothetical protein IT176_08650 [Acidobacteria bacterium]|nr:hypothetical protein [Acidobacteriota bacterium]